MALRRPFERKTPNSTASEGHRTRHSGKITASPCAIRFHAIIAQDKRTTTRSRRTTRNVPAPLATLRLGELTSLAIGFIRLSRSNVAQPSKFIVLHSKTKTQSKQGYLAESPLRPAVGAPDATGQIRGFLAVAGHEEGRRKQPRCIIVFTPTLQKKTYVDVLVLRQRVATSFTCPRGTCRCPIQTAMAMAMMEVYEQTASLTCFFSELRRPGTLTLQQHAKRAAVCAHE